ncbi:hypothetical protein ZIOFF_006030 [Zingiber officinale]|uniref:Ribosomal protein L34e superfamily protein n=1 Tax=Zingiber officinale TaxID=94328 RepID=A0A8J5I250_ZINOF|nr:hypothetical protein ZIOFF_006030 [Zingiber officinale]
MTLYQSQNLHHCISKSLKATTEKDKGLIGFINLTDCRPPPFPYLAGFLLSLVAFAAAAHFSCRLPLPLRRRCGRPRCLGLKKALEFDVQLQTEECIRSPDPVQSTAWKGIDDLPWKGGQQGNNPDYECLRAELRRMAPPNGRAVLLFRARCGCPLSKLEGWGPKRGNRRHKK